MDLRVRPLSNLRGLSMPYRRAAICSDSSTSTSQHPLAKNRFKLTPCEADHLRVSGLFVKPVLLFLTDCLTTLAL